jgi:thioredoxin reductase
MEHQADWDVIIVGRSYAGLAAALFLGRARRSVLVIGDGGPRNEAVAHVHGYPTRDGAGPAELIAQAEAELERYPSVQLVSGRVTELSGAVGRFSARFGDHRTSGANIIVATGVNDAPPPVPGLAEHWGRGVFTCPFCDGWEHQDLPLGLVGDPTIAAHLGRVLSNWSDSVTVFADVTDDTVLAAFAERGVTVERRPVARIVGDGASVSAVALDDGDQISVGAVFVAAAPTPNSGLAASVGCDLDPNGVILVDGNGATSVPGVWAAGDVTQPGRHQVAIAVSGAVIAASSICATLF